MKCLYWASGHSKGLIIDVRPDVYTENELINIAQGVWATIDCPAERVQDALKGRMAVSDGALVMLPEVDWPENQEVV
jgi:hypothetical protein